MAESCCPTNKSGTNEDNILSPVAFPTRSRVHIAINVRKNVYEIAPFYSTLFGAEPTTLVEKYAKFELDEPPINLTINEFADNARGEAVFGVQIKNAQRLSDAHARLERNKIAVEQRQGGISVRDPDGNRWEVFVDMPSTSVLR